MQFAFRPIGIILGIAAGTVGRVASENRRPLIIGGAVLVAFLLGRAAAGRE